MLVSYSSSSEEENENDDSDKGKRKCFDDDSSSVCKRQKCVARTRGDHTPKTETRPAEASARLPLPDSVLDMFKDSEDAETEDSSLHGGRVRSFQHERGNWATYVYLPYVPDEGFLELVDEMMEVLAAHGFSLSRAEEFHISLSQTVVLRHHWIQPFVLSLQTGLATCRRSVCVAEKVKVYTNQEKTRTFLGVEVTTGHAQLLELVRAVDQTMEEFRLSTFYQNPSFHISLAWCVGDSADLLQKECLQELQRVLDDHEDGSFLLNLECQELRCKSGNKIFSFPLH